MKHILALLLLVNISCGYSYNILFFHDIGTKSHLHLYYPLVEVLLERGHEVTGVYYGSAKIQHENYTELQIPDNLGKLMKNLSSLYMEEGNSKSNIISISRLASTWHLLPKYVEDVISTFEREDVKKILQKQFDIVISSSNNVGYVAHVTDSKIIFISPPGPISMFTSPIGNRFYPSLSPALGSTFTDPSSMSQRFNNWFASVMIDVWTIFHNEFQLYPGLVDTLNYNGPTLLKVISERSQLVLSNSHSITHEPQPFLENVVHVGGLHIKQTKPLPQDLQIFMDSSPQGVLLVSFGSSITPSSMSEEKRKVFLEVFEKINIPVIWKWDTGVTADVPKNVLIKDWLPQQDLLAHPNLKVFVTHGGLLSIMEAIYHETVLVGIPLGNDQRPNLVRLESKNLGIMLDWDNLSAQEMILAIQKAMTDVEMAKSMKEMSRLFKDTPARPVEKAAWWIEFVIRNGGADYFKPNSMNLPWYKVLNLDILVLVLLCILVSVYISYKIFKSCLRCCCSKGNIVYNYQYYYY
ncbi:UDP-glucuronosyltransferase 2B19 [Eurytemora carolleeae]|uniref:UDP-glucuronosyltransferase 2B19 n=1 Tax=Eurytemora carolleeae TaxID=1294199 RepID=UPI000C770FB3|nr:UDP-glucuronosyltransferase 2B19 [Eurytemora carolleeae]|eukprot:XP_023320254.1 UDP-glucuronosyltransferase 2B19-like [Eurytemora affinis]